MCIAEDGTTLSSKANAGKTEKVKSTKNTQVEKKVEDSKIGKCFRERGGGKKRKSGALRARLVLGKESCTALMEKRTDYGCERSGESQCSCDDVFMCHVYTVCFHLHDGPVLGLKVS